MKKPRQPRPDPAIEAALAAMAAGIEAAAGGSITDTVARWLAARYAATAREQLEDLDGPERMAFLGEFVRDWTLLRRGDHTAARLQIERDRLELEREQTEARRVSLFKDWLDDPERLRQAGLDKLSRDDRERRLREIFGLGEKRPEGLSTEALAEIEDALKMF